MIKLQTKIASWVFRICMFFFALMAIAAATIPHHNMWAWLIGYACVTYSYSEIRTWK